MKVKEGGAERGKEREICAATKDDNKCAMMFHVTDSKRILAAVVRTVEAGSRVVFEGKAQGSFIEHVKTGRRVFMEKRRGFTW